MKLIFIKKNFLIYGGAENYMKTLIDRFQGKSRHPHYGKKMGGNA